MASRSVNKVILIGHCTRDAETKYTPGGAAVTKFSVATNRRWKDKQTDEWKEEVNYTNVVLWQSEKLAEFLTRGKQVYIEGRLQTRSYDDKDGKKMYATEVVADEVLLLGGQNESTGANGQARATGASDSAKGRTSGAAVAQEEYGGITMDDVPF
jgi:single-strand DNA-binding protein